MARYDDILDTIGHTPTVRLKRLAPEGVNVWVKVESFNPMGSVKDRLARAVIEDAERSGRLAPGQTVIEATSGNTGIGLAMVCAAKGYPLVIVMSENFSVERRRLMRFLGAKVVLTPAAEKGTGMLAKAVELAEAHGWFLCRQFENEANADAHSQTTAQEILADFDGDRLDAFVTGFGTGGTLKGVARVLRKERPETRIVACEPDNSPILGSGIPQPRDAEGRVSGSHPLFRPHLMQGWSPDFVPKLVEDSVDGKLFDEVRAVPGNEALRLSHALAREEGIFVGISAGATLAAGLAFAETAEPGANVLCMLPDTGERYLSTPLFAEIDGEMNDDEWAISRSTPGFRFDQPSAPPPPSNEEEAASEPASVDTEATRWVDDLVGNDEQPVVMFALEWCEFCWSARKLFGALGIDYRSVDLDSVAYQENDRGGRIRGVLQARTGEKTIPQIFVGGRHVGGCTDLFDAFKSGQLGEWLREAGVSADHRPELDPYSLLPQWLHARGA